MLDVSFCEPICFAQINVLLFRLSGLDLTSKSVSNETINPLVKVKENINLPDVPISTTPPRNEVNLSAMTKVHVQEPKCTVSETALYQSVAQNPKRSK